MSQAKRDQNNVTTLLAVSSVDGVTPVVVYADPITHRLLTDTASGTGTVTSVSVVTANGFAGSVATATTTPAITISTTITGILSGNGTAISAASTTGSGAVVLANTPTLITPNIGAATGSSLTTTGLITTNLGLQLKETGAGTDLIAIVAPSSIATGYTLTLPIDDGTPNQVLTTDGSGVLSWSTPTTGTVTSVSGTANRITSTGGVTPVIDISATFEALLGKVANPLSQFASTTSLQLLGVISDETGTGSLVFANTPTLVTPLLGTPTSGNLSNCTAYPVASLSGLGSNVATFLTTPSSANLASALTDETGTGVAVFNAKPTFIGTVNTIVAVAALALDGSLGSIFTKTIGTGSTLTQSNFSTGQCFLVKITGAFTVTWFSGITWITSGATVPTQAAITTYGFVCTGSNTFDGYLVGTQ